MSDEPPFPFDAEAIAAALAHAAMAQGDANCVTALAVSIPRLDVTGYADWQVTLAYVPKNYRDYIALLTLYLEVPTESFSKFYPVREVVQKKLFEMFQPIIASYPKFRASGVCIVPSSKGPENWRDRTLAWLRAEGVNNQGRVRSDNIAARQYDGLLFRSDEEINLYRAFKALGVTFAPLPVFVRGGASYRRIEPDFIIVKDGMVALIEVDGPIHRESPAEAHARTAMLVNEGAHVERVRASDCATMEGAEVCAKRVLATLSKVKASR
jgi:hypothetical protein